MRLSREILTARFRLTPKIWHIYDWVPPRPIPMWPALFAMGVLFVEWRLGMVAAVERVPFPVNLGIVLALPALVWHIAGKPAIEGKPVQLYLLSQLRYWLREPNALAGMVPVHEPKTARTELSIWVPSLPRNNTAVPGSVAVGRERKGRRARTWIPRSPRRRSGTREKADEQRASRDRRARWPGANDVRQR